MSDDIVRSQDEFGDPHGLPWRVAPWGDGSSDTGNSNIISDRWQVVIASEMPTETAEFIVASVRFTTEAAAEIERLRAALQNLTTKMGAQKAVTGRGFSIAVEVALRSARAAWRRPAPTKGE
jgi:hypothetical protein